MENNENTLLRELQNFSEKWKGKGQEDKDDRSFLIELANMYSIKNPTDFYEFQKRTINSNYFSFVPKKEEVEKLFLKPLKKF